MDDLRILIIGAGVAGLTCAGLLRRQGLQPTVVERQPREQFNRSGYMLGLLPLGGRVLNELDLQKRFLESSTMMKSYNIHAGNGRLLKAYPLDFIHENYGSYRGISRMKLIDLLLERTPADDIRFDTTVTSIHDRQGSVDVTFSDGETGNFNLVVAADGLKSHSRSLVLDKNEFHYRSTGWGGWVTWRENLDEHEYKEFWGAGDFVGLYPVKEKTGVFIGGRLEKIADKEPSRFTSEIAKHFSDPDNTPERAFHAMDAERDPFFWKFEDVRSDVWYRGNTVLLGDAATGFLPTAGVGASMAMDSAAALADELSRADAGHLQYALKLYTRRQRPKAETAQSDSRKLGQLMFVNGTTTAWARDRLVPFYSLQRMVSDLVKVMEGDT